MVSYGGTLCVDELPMLRPCNPVFAFTFAQSIGRTRRVGMRQSAIPLQPNAKRSSSNGKQKVMAATLKL